MKLIYFFGNIMSFLFNIIHDILHYNVIKSNGISFKDMINYEVNNFNKRKEYYE